MQFDSFYSEIAFWLLHHVSNHFLVELDMVAGCALYFILNSLSDLGHFLRMRPNLKHLLRFFPTLTDCNLYFPIEDDGFYVFNFLEFSASNPFVFAILHT